MIPFGRNRRSTSLGRRCSEEVDRTATRSVVRMLRNTPAGTSREGHGGGVGLVRLHLGHHDRLFLVTGFQGSGKMTLLALHCLRQRFGRVCRRSPASIDSAPQPGLLGYRRPPSRDCSDCARDVRRWRRQPSGTSSLIAFRARVGPVVVGPGEGQPPHRRLPKGHESGRGSLRSFWTKSSVRRPKERKECLTDQKTTRTDLVRIARVQRTRERRVRRYRGDSEKACNLGGVHTRQLPGGIRTR